jgi:integrase/recombinase XerD
MTSLAPALEGFFTQRLLAQRRASPNTVAAYRDTFRLLLRYMQETTGVSPSKLQIEDLDAPRVAAFLDYLEQSRGAKARTRNARLAAVHSLFRYLALQHPEHGALVQRVLAIPVKKAEHAVVSFLGPAEADALLEAPDLSTRLGRRDNALLALALQTGLRVSELVGLRCQDVYLGRGANVRCLGKGRKERCTPLTKETAAVLRAWLRERAGLPEDPLFPGPSGRPLTRDAVRRIVSRHVATAATSQPALAARPIGPHVLRHSCAMGLRAGGVDLPTIALWLGHESVRTTGILLRLRAKVLVKAVWVCGRRRSHTARLARNAALLAGPMGLAGGDVRAAVDLVHELPVHRSGSFEGVGELTEVCL